MEVRFKYPTDFDTAPCCDRDGLARAKALVGWCTGIHFSWVRRRRTVMAGRRVQVYKRRDGDWGWRRLSANNNITAIDGEGYQTPSAAEKAAKRENPGLPIVRKRR